MKLNSKLEDQLRSACAAVGASPVVEVTDLDFYPGATPHSVQPSLVCHLKPTNAPGTIGEILERLRARHGARFDAPRSRAKADEAANALNIGALAAELAARLVSSLMGPDLEWGAREAADGRAMFWIEYFPSGADYNRVLAPFRAVRCVLVAIAEACSDEGGAGSTDRDLRQLSETLSQQAFHAQSQFLINGARRRNIPILNVGGSSLAWQFGWGSRSETFYVTASGEDSVPGHQCTRNKAITKAMFRDLGLPTPKWQVLARPEAALAAAKTIGWPCVVKPLGEAHGEGVTAGITDEAGLEAAVSRACGKSPLFMVEAHEPGDDYRLMVVDGRMVAAVRREPPFVIGDGRSSVRELVARLNERRKGPLRETGYLSPVAVDAALEAKLAKHGLSLESPLSAGERLVLLSVANRSTGGSAVEVTSQVHPQVQRLAELLAQASGLRTAGIDYITTDISRSPDEVGGGFIEVNAMPGLGVLMAAGRAEEEIVALVLGDRPARIPVTLVLAPGETIEEIGEALMAKQAATGSAAIAAGRSARIGGTALPVTALDPFATVSAALRYRSVEKLTIAWSAADLYRYGVPVDKLHRIVILGPPPSGEWLSLLNRLCSDVVVAPDSAAAIEAASGA